MKISFFFELFDLSHCACVYALLFEFLILLKAERERDACVNMSFAIQVIVIQSTGTLLVKRLIPVTRPPSICIRHT